MKIRKTYRAYGTIVLGLRGEALDFTGRKIDAYSAKQARWLLAKELSEKELKGHEQLAILNALKRHKVQFKN